MAGNKRSGRAEYAPTDDEREKVRVLKAGGMSNDAICVAIGISAPTLRKHFAFDLELGSAKVTADVLMARYRSAMGGNVSAQNKMLELVGAIPPPPKKAPKLPKLGKKEQAEIEAQAVPADPEWGTVLQ